MMVITIAKFLFNDYNEAVNEYKKSFPSKVNVIENTPIPAVREMLVHMEKLCETCFDRFDRQSLTAALELQVFAARIAIWTLQNIEKSPRGGMERMLISL